MPPKRRRENKGYFQKGYDPRRHVLTAEERRRGGVNCAKKFTVRGRWYTDWWDRCAAQKKGDD